MGTLCCQNPGRRTSSGPLESGRRARAQLFVGCVRRHAAVNRFFTDSIPPPTTNTPKPHKILNKIPAANMALRSTNVRRDFKNLAAYEFRIL